MNKQHGFLFTAPMVRAIMANPMRKTCTRRVVSPYNSLIDGTGRGIRACWPEMHWKEARAIRSGQAFKVSCFQCGRPHIVTPRVQPGDWIYVKETWAIHSQSMEGQGVGYVLQWRADHATRKHFFDGRVVPVGVAPKAPQPWPTKAIDKGWRSPLHMPKYAARAWLPVTKAGAGFVQSISEEDAIAEGVTCWMCGARVDGRSENDCGCFHSKREAIPSFAALWNSIHGETDPKSWAANPACWDFHWEERRDNQ